MVESLKLGKTTGDFSLGECRHPSSVLFAGVGPFSHGSSPPPSQSQIKGSLGAVGTAVMRGVNRYPTFWNSDSNRQPTGNSVGHQQIYRTEFGTTPKYVTSRAMN